MAFLKRKRVMAPRRGGFKKRRKFTRRSRVPRSVGSTRWTGGVSDMGAFRSKKITRRRWKKLLWDSTLQSEHFRSIGARSATQTTPASLVTASTGLIAADDNNVAPPYQTLGGLVDFPVANMNKNIVLRGGQYRITITNDAAVTTPMQVMIWGLRSGDGFASATFPATVPVGWDPTTIPNFKVIFGTIITKRSFILGNQDTVSLTMRDSIRKVDTTEWVAGNRRHYWLIYSANLETAAAQTLTIVDSFNVSFCGDSS